MLVVSNPISDESQVTAGDGGQGKLNIEDYIWPHGITPPLRHVRKRRYRKRISRRVRPSLSSSLCSLKLTSSLSCCRPSRSSNRKSSECWNRIKELIRSPTVRLASLPLPPSFPSRSRVLIASPLPFFHFAHLSRYHRGRRPRRFRLRVPHAQGNPSSSSSRQRVWGWFSDGRWSDA